ncbi:MAG TPA: right-handed parallel beta-helix repeat-containing protein [Terriglobales bacterium]|nr:right-handed parallel beta-helix repeat-containing protein [Terriglobales bacterium]
MMRTILYVVCLSAALSLLVSGAYAANVTVRCGHQGEGEDSFPSVSAALSHLNPSATNTITVSGACNENVVIQGFDRLTLVASPGASINDASNGADWVVFITDSHRVALQGFAVNGGGGGIACFNNSLCRFAGNTIQNSMGDGLFVNSSQAELNGDTIQNHAGRGLVLGQGSHARAIGESIVGNGASGIRLVNDGFLFALGNTINNNGFYGIRLTDHSSAQMTDNTITGNAAGGVGLETSSEGHFSVSATGNVITGNAGNGVTISDLSFANFDSPGNNISGNATQPDVACNPQTSAARGALANIGTGTTNCAQ